jgi:hypothetical protein
VGVDVRFDPNAHRGGDAWDASNTTGREPENAMLRTMTDYFLAEKSESLLFIAVGGFSIAIAVWLWRDGHRLKAMAFPLVAIALIQLVVGASVYFRTDAQLAQLSRQSTAAPAEFKQAETSRMQVVMRNFKLYRWIEVVLLAVGVLLIAALPRHDVAVAIGGGLVLQSAFMLLLDLFAEARGQDYMRALTAF